MPRDLESEKPEPIVTLTESPSHVVDIVNKPEEEESETDTYPREFVIIPQDSEFRGQGNNKYKRPTNLHPYTRPLTISDLESVVALENAAFSDPNERASREKVNYSDFGKTRDHISTQTDLLLDHL